MSAIVLFRGHVVGDGPELKVSQAGKAWVRFSVATKPMKKVEGGGYEKPKNPVFLEVRAFGDLAREIANSIDARDYIEGTGTYEQQRWEDEDGGKHQRDYVVTNALPFVRPRRDQNGAAAVPADESDPWGTMDEPPFDEGY